MLQKLLHFHFLGKENAREDLIVLKPTRKYRKQIEGSQRAQSAPKPARNCRKHIEGSQGGHTAPKPVRKYRKQIEGSYSQCCQQSVRPTSVRPGSVSLTDVGLTDCWQHCE